ncbi:alpha/beta fold hydrolase [Sediminibacillus albus]|uniref:Pimeloyl-ACP methyl ester carboxylesterase n=1 Tax=Sediminibacillus albus TaxID=407036 RepID=A0A1G9BDX1_9BACI|nr:alpha/beta hydrolase [Sediminibacillus albus]SDK37718.1 Pimeloyl-ACP methyl ester carboxylesterase [Sediminibacillus albus]
MKKWELTKQFDSSYGTVRFKVVGQGPPLVLVHGTPWSSFNWRHIVPALREWYTVYYYDLLGYGQSEKKENQNVSLGIQNEILTELLQYWELDSPIIIGHDFGGTTALRAHLLNKVHFNRMILMDPVAVGPWGSSFFSHVYKHEEAFKGVPSFIHKSIISAYIEGAQYSKMSEKTKEGIIQYWLGDRGQHAFYRQIAQADQTYTDEVEHLYSKIDIPTLILWGEDDEWVPIEKGYALHEKIIGSQFRSIPYAGHLIQEEAPAVVLGHIIKFLNDSSGDYA